MHIETVPAAREVESLLAATNLPTEDIPGNKRISFFGIRNNDALVATIGIERLSSQIGFMRSVAVTPAFQGRGLATELVAFCERWAKLNDIQTLYLLTSGASAFFERKGYLAMSREHAPVEVMATAQFSSLCPSAATLMQKIIQ